MDNRRDDYLNRVLEFLVDDTKVDHRNRFWYPPFPTPHPHPTFNTFYNLIPWSQNLSLPLNNSYVIHFFNYCSDTYGLSDFYEIKKLWIDYLNTLTKKINEFPLMNESVDRKKEFLDKVAHFIVDDSVIEYEDKSVKPPFTTLWFDASYICNGLPSDSLLYTFFRYCEDVYNLNSVESNYVWGVYSSIICNKFNNSINESVDRKQDYLDKIVGYLVDDTKIEVVSKRWNPPFMTIWLERSGLFSHDVPHAGIFHRFYEYCKETYGLTDGEMMGVWNKYTKSLIYKLRDF